MLAGRAVVGGAVMFATAGAGSGQQVGGQDPENVNPISPTRAKAGCAGAPLPPSAPSSASGQQQANGQQFVNSSFCQSWSSGFVGNVGGCRSQQGQGSQGFVSSFLRGVPGAGFGNVGSGLNSSLPV